MRKRAWNSAEAQTASLQNHLYGPTTGWAGNRLQSHKLSRHLHTRRNRATHQANRVSSAGMDIVFHKISPRRCFCGYHRTNFRAIFLIARSFQVWFSNRRARFRKQGGHNPGFNNVGLPYSSAASPYNQAMACSQGVYSGPSTNQGEYSGGAFSIGEG